MSLDKGTISASLSQFGRSAVDNQQAFLQLSVSEAALEDISCIKDYIHLQDVDLHGNRLTGLAPLQFLPQLFRLNVSGNKLTTVIGFCAPQCTPENKWAEGDVYLGSSLQICDFSNNLIERIDDLSDHKLLRELNLSDNKIKVIEGLAKCKNLRTLNLCNNQIEVIEGLDNLPLEKLECKNNGIVHCKGVGKAVQSLLRLDLQNNRLCSLEGLEDAHNLHHLNVEGNQIGSIHELGYLAELEFLRELVLKGNPLEEQQHYRKRVLFHLPQLSVLDGIPVTAEEKVKAQNLHGEDVSHRRSVFEAHLPKDEFENLLPPFVEAPLMPEPVPMTMALFDDTEAKGEEEESSTDGVAKRTTREGEGE